MIDDKLVGKEGRLLGKIEDMNGEDGVRVGDCRKVATIIRLWTN